MPRDQWPAKWLALIGWHLSARAPIGSPSGWHLWDQDVEGGLGPGERRRVHSLFSPRHAPSCASIFRVTASPECAGAIVGEYGRWFAPDASGHLPSPPTR